MIRRSCTTIAFKEPADTGLEKIPRRQGKKPQRRPATLYPQSRGFARAVAKRGICWARQISCHKRVRGSCVWIRGHRPSLFLHKAGLQLVSRCNCPAWKQVIDALVLCSFRPGTICVIADRDWRFGQAESSKDRQNWYAGPTQFQTPASAFSSTQARRRISARKFSCVFEATRQELAIAEPWALPMKPKTVANAVRGAWRAYQKPPKIIDRS